MPHRLLPFVFAFAACASSPRPRDTELPPGDTTAARLCRDGVGVACLAAGRELADQPGTTAVSYLRAACDLGVVAACRSLGEEVEVIADRLAASDDSRSRCSASEPAACAALTQLALLEEDGQQDLVAACRGTTVFGVCDEAPEEVDPCEGRAPDGGMSDVSDVEGSEEGSGENGTSCPMPERGDMEACLAVAFGLGGKASKETVTEVLEVACEQADEHACQMLSELRTGWCRQGDDAACVALASVVTDGDKIVLAVLEEAGERMMKACGKVPCEDLLELCQTRRDLSACPRHTLALMQGCAAEPTEAICGVAAAEPGVFGTGQTFPAQVKRDFEVGCLDACRGDTRTCACGCEMVHGQSLDEEAEPMIATEIFEPEDLDERALEGAIERGRVATRKGRYAEAMKAFEEALVENPEDPRALGGLGFAALLAGELDVARARTSEALAVSSDAAMSAALEYNLGRVFEARGMWLEAYAAYLRSLVARRHNTETQARRDAVRAKLLSR